MCNPPTNTQHTSHTLKSAPSSHALTKKPAVSTQPFHSVSKTDSSLPSSVRMQSRIERVKK